MPSYQLTNFLSVENMVSNNVMEWALDTLNRKLVQARQQKAKSQEGVDLVELLQDRKQQLELAMQLLVLRVQTGKLTMEDYRTTLEEKVKEETERARMFKAQGNIPAAKMALQRAKIMREELAEC